MRFEVEFGGRTRAIAIERTDRPGRFRVSVDGVPHVLDVARTSDFVLSVLTIADTVPFLPAESHERVAAPSSNPEPVTLSREIGLTPLPAAGQLLVNLDGRTATVTVNGRRTGHAAEAGAQVHGEVAITAPMPGRVVRLLAAPGDAVNARQGIVVVEAMKMENELRAPRAGRVKQVCAAPGTSVEAGRILAVIE
jgi:biotin carboxyl carrier protein